MSGLRVLCAISPVCLVASLFVAMSPTGKSYAAVVSLCNSGDAPVWVGIVTDSTRRWRGGWESRGWNKVEPRGRGLFKKDCTDIVSTAHDDDYYFTFAQPDTNGRLGTVTMGRVKQGALGPWSYPENKLFCVQTELGNFRTTGRTESHIQGCLAHWALAKFSLRLFTTYDAEYELEIPARQNARLTPFENRYAGIAYNTRDGTWGASWNYPTREAAETRAISECGNECIVGWVRNGCISVASGKSADHYHFAHERLEEDATDLARQRCGSGCQTRVVTCSNGSVQQQP